jgi:hypothetical protein
MEPLSLAPRPLVCLRRTSGRPAACWPTGPGKPSPMRPYPRSRRSMSRFGPSCAPTAIKEPYWKASQEAPEDPGQVTLKAGLAKVISQDPSSRPSLSG